MLPQTEPAGDYEQELARGVLAGDARAVEEFKKLLRPELYRLMRLYPGVRRFAYDYADGVDQVVTYLIMGLRQTKKALTCPSFSPVQKWLADPRGSLAGFCLVSARNYLFDLSRIKELPTYPLPEAETQLLFTPALPFLPVSLEEEIFDKELKRAVQDVYERLPPHDRRILMLKYHFDLSDAEIGHELGGVSETTARKRRNLAEEKFRRLFLSKYGPVF